MAKKRLLLFALFFSLAMAVFAAEPPPVTIQCVFPKAGQVVQGNSVRVVVAMAHARSSLRPYLILNNGAPREIDAPDHSLVLKNLPEGGQTLRLWVAHRGGRALGNPESFTLVRFFVGRRDFQNLVDPASPFFTVTQPLAGIDGGIDRRIDFDFLLANAALAKEKGYVIRCSINQDERLVTEKKPVFWDNLDPGHYPFVAELLTSDLQPVPGLFNRVTRTVEVPVIAKAVPIKPTGPLPRRRPED